MYLTLTQLIHVQILLFWKRMHDYPTYPLSVLLPCRWWRGLRAFVTRPAVLGESPVHAYRRRKARLKVAHHTGYHSGKKSPYTVPGVCVIHHTSQRQEYIG